MQRTLSYVLLLVPVSSAPSPTPNLVPAQLAGALRALTLVPAGLPTTQVGALEAIYDATSGTRWRYGRAGAMWSFASSQAAQSDPCLSRWAGVRCDSKNSSVIALDVNSMGLVGTLPEKIGALTALTYQDKEWKSPAILATAYISYQPSFRYGYGCSSALVTTYASVFVNMALFSCVAGPLWLVTVRNLIDREWLSKDFGAWFLPALIQTSQERQIRSNAASTAMGFLSSGKLGAHSSNKKIVDTPAMFLEIMQDLLALLTFGLVAPMCGLAIAVALIVKLLAFRYALELFRSTQPAEDVEALSADCNDFSQHAHPFVETHPIILMLSSLFLSAFLVDIAGDAVGLNDAMWAPALMWILPLLLSQLRAQFFASSPSTRVACNSPTASPAEVELPGAYRGSVFDLQSTYNSTGPSSCSQQTTVDIPNPILLRGSHKFASATANSEAEQLFDPSAWKTPSAAEGVLGGSAAAAFSEQHHKDSIPGPIDSELRDSPLTPVSPADSIDTLATIASAVDHSLAPRYPPPLLDLHPAGSLSSIPIEVTPASLPP